MTSHDEMLDNVALYSMGVLPAEGAAAVATHMQTCTECRAEYRFLQPAVTAVAYSEEASAKEGAGTTVSPLLKARIMKQVRPERRWPVFFSPGYAMVVVLVLVILVTGLFARVEIAQRNAYLADINATDAQRTPFGTGELVTHDERIYIAFETMPQLPDGTTYEAWIKPKGATAMQPSVLFAPSANGQTVIRLPGIASATSAVAVTVEPSGGSKQPTSSPIASANL